MRLICYCDSCRRKIIISSTAKSRSELLYKFGYSFSIICNHCYCKNNKNAYHVYAESTYAKTVVSTVGGGTVGILGGPFGVMIGTALGWAFGAYLRSQDRKAAKEFNES